MMPVKTFAQRDLAPAPTTTLVPPSEPPTGRARGESSGDVCYPLTAEVTRGIRIIAVGIGYTLADTGPLDQADQTQCQCTGYQSYYQAEVWQG